METVIYGGLTRGLQTLILAAPTLLVGLFIAALFRYFLGNDGMRKLFGGDSLRSLPQSWALGMLLPVCSIGVIPIIQEMRRAKIRPGAITAFALSAPLFNPLSLLYGLTLSQPIVILGFSFGSLLVVTIIGWIWDKYATAEESNQADHVPLVSYGVKRIAACVTYMARELFGMTGLYTLIAAGGIVLLGMMLPHGAMQTSVEQNDPMAPLTMAAVSIPIYSTPMMIMSQLGMMFAHGNSPGAAFALLILGTGMNLATIVWIARAYSLRSAALWLAGLFLVVISCAYTIDKPLIPKGVEPAGHTHAFDVYTNPFHRQQPILWSTIQSILEETSDFATSFSLRTLAVFLIVGLALQIAGTSNRLEKWIFQPDPEAAKRSFDTIVSPMLVGMVAIIGLVVLSIVGCFAYYPPPAETLKQMQIAKGEVLSSALSKDYEASLAWIPIWEEWSRKLEVGTFLRKFDLRPYQKMQTYLLRKQLELLEHELEHQLEDHDDHDHNHHHAQEQKEIEALVQRLSKTSMRVSSSFRD